MKKWQVLFVFFVAGSMFAGEIIKTDFSKCDNPAKDKLGRENTNISGKLPAGWSDDSLWGKATVKYVPEEERGGGKYLQIQVPAPGSGKRGQLVNLNVPDLTEKTTYTIKFRLRNPGQTLISIGLRMKEKPWTMLWQKINKFSPEWKNYEFTFTLDKKDVGIGIWINMPPGTVLDIKSLELNSKKAK